MLEETLWSFEQENIPEEDVQEEKKNEEEPGEKEAEETGRGQGEKIGDPAEDGSVHHEYSRLTREEEHALAVDIQNGRRAKKRLEQLQENGETAKEENVRRLEEAVKRGERSRNELVIHNLDLVDYQAGRMWKSADASVKSGLIYSDLISDGSLALVEAAKGFDPERGTRFSTYAAKIIRNALKQTFKNARPVRFPQKKEAALSEASQALAEKLDRAPTAEELAEQTGIALDAVAIYLKLKNGALSLAEEYEEDECGELETGRVIVASREPTPEEQFELDNAPRASDIIRTLSNIEECIYWDVVMKKKLESRADYEGYAKEHGITCQELQRHIGSLKNKLKNDPVRYSGLKEALKSHKAHC